MLPYRMESPTARPTRRQFLVGVASAAGLVVGYRIVGPDAAAAQSSAAPPAPVNPFQAYVEITPDDRIVIYSSQFEMGQGSYFGIATLVMEELGGDWTRVDVVGGSGNPALYGNLAWGGFAQGTGGSTSMTSSFDRYRQAGAVAREMLVAAAASRWNVAAGEIRVEKGVLMHPSGKSAAFGDVAAEAASMPVPHDVQLKPNTAWTEIGSEKLRRYDSRVKANGTQTYTIDVKLDGLLTAVMIHPPKFGSRLVRFDATEAKNVVGVVDVVETPRGIAVVGRDMWTALKGREAVIAEWDDREAELRSSAEILADYRDLAKGAPAATARNDGDVHAALAAAATTIEAEYEFPYLAHASLEPLNAIARMNPDGVLEVWGGHQMPDLYQAAAAAAGGITPEKVRLHVMKTGGSFGRRAVADADLVVEAVTVARAIGWRAPVKVQWTRENDMRGGRYRPAYVHSVKAGLDAAGRLVALHDHIVGQSIMGGSPFAAMIQGGVDPTSVEGASNLPYAIPNVRVDLTTTELKIPVLWWRSVGSTHTAYVIETLIDELAQSAGLDPVAFRLSMLGEHPRHAAVLKLAAEKAGWGEKLPEGRFRGVALHESFHSFVAEIAEITFRREGDFTVDRVVCAVDCGIAINPDQVRAQMEGGIGFGLGAILQEELTLTDGVVDQANYDTYKPLRIDAMPRIEVHIMPSDEPPTGVGEPGVPPIGPAIANALRSATGKPIRKLPILKGVSPA